MAAGVVPALNEAMHAAGKPLAGLLKGLAGLSAVIPLDQLNVPVASVPQLQTVILGAVLLATCLVGMRVIED